MNGTFALYVNKASELEILNHLSSCDDEFVQALLKRADIKEYCNKIYTNAVRFEAWESGKLVGLVAGYCNDRTRLKAYITSVSVLMEWQGKGIAQQLLGRFIEHVKLLGMRGISLEVARENARAVRLYQKCGFESAGDCGSTIIMNLII